MMDGWEFGLKETRLVKKTAPKFYNGIIAFGSGKLAFDWSVMGPGRSGR